MHRICEIKVRILAKKKYRILTTEMHFLYNQMLQQINFEKQKTIVTSVYI